MILSSFSAIAQNDCFLRKNPAEFDAKQKNPYSIQLLSQNHSILSTIADDPPQENIKPSLKAGRIAGELLLGGIGSILGGFIGFHLVSGEDLENMGTPLILVAAMGFGSSVMVYSAGNSDYETGSFPITLLSGLAGSVIGALFAESTDAYSLLLFPPICATIGFNSTRKYKSPAGSGTAIINFRDGKLRPDIPSAYFGISSLDGITLVTNLDLINVRF